MMDCSWVELASSVKMRPTSFFGLFTHHKTPVGSFIGFYTGMYMNGRSETTRPKRDEYAIQTSDDLIVSLSVQRRRPDPNAHPLAIANE